VLGILLTHAHIDHIGALDAFAVPVYLHETDLPLLRDRVMNGSALFRQVLPFALDDLEIRTLQDGSTLPLGGGEIRVLHTPGHTAGSICFRFEDDLLTGDTLFASAVGRWDFPTGSRAALRTSVVALIDGIDDEVRIHPGHGPACTIGEERRTNPHYLGWKREAGSSAPDKADL
jgi:hydroxyacylglutathione hydrolase